MEQIWQDTMLRAVLGLLLANVLARIAQGLSTRSLPLATLIDWLTGQLAPWLLRAAIVEIVLLSLPPEWGDLRPLARGGVCVCVCSALLRHLVEALREPA
jgi:hypothetical protein